MIKNWKIKDLTLLGFSIPTGLIICFSAIVYVTSNQIGQTFKQVNNSQNALTATNHAHIDMLNMDRRIRRYLIDNEFKKEALDLYTKDQQDFQQSWNLATRVVEDTRQKEKLNKMYQLYDAYDFLKKELLNKNSGNLNKDENHLKVI
ncbi:MAG: hypothetical protein HC773_27205 [Scytonema sp. CRU_2_7]|nr:hypothetical protein [Scytonema sp. CRU_2_7]